MTTSQHRVIDPGKVKKQCRQCKTAGERLYKCRPSRCPMKLEIIKVDKVCHKCRRYNPKARGNYKCYTRKCPAYTDPHALTSSGRTLNKQKKLVKAIMDFEKARNRSIQIIASPPVSIADYSDLFRAGITGTGLVGRHVVEAIDIALHGQDASVEQETIDFCLRG